VNIQFTAQIFKEGRAYVAHNTELDVSSCASTKEKALSNLKEAVHLFLEETEKMGTLTTILEEAGFIKRSAKKFEGPRFITTRQVSLSLA
jgi:predicted RNase H-like HicB family nuclease